MDEMHEAVTAVLGEIDFDPEELHKKYLSERDKRLRDDHNDQYVRSPGSSQSIWTTSTRRPWKGASVRRG